MPSDSGPSSARTTASFASWLATGPFGGDVAGDALRLVQPGLAGDDAGDEAGVERLAGRETAAGEDDVHRQRLADRAREPLCAAGARDEAEAGLRLAEDRRLGGHDDVARHRQLAAAAEAEAGDGGDERRAHGADRVPGVDPAATYISTAEAVASSPMSAPAANTRSEPPTTMQRISGSASSS